MPLLMTVQLGERDATELILWVPRHAGPSVEYIMKKGSELQPPLRLPTIVEAATGVLDIFSRSLTAALREARHATRGEGQTRKRGPQRGAPMPSTTPPPVCLLAFVFVLSGRYLNGLLGQPRRVSNRQWHDALL